MPARIELDNFSDPPLSAFQPSKDSFNQRQRALLLLAEGHLAARITNLVGLTQWNVYKIAKRAEKAGALVKESFFRPAIYKKGPTFDEYLRNRIGKSFSPTMRNQKKVSKSNIATPHHFPVYYNIRNSYRPIGKKLARRNWEAIEIETDDITAIWQTKTLTVWVKSFNKGSPEQKIKDGLDQVSAYADMERCNGAKLTFQRLGKRIEWVIEQEKLSDYLTATLGLKESAKIIAKALWLPKDITHDHVEVNKENGMPDEGATEAIKTLDYLLDREKFIASYVLLQASNLAQEEALRLTHMRINLLEQEILRLKKV
jgi:hypothetical protein